MESQNAAKRHNDSIDATRAELMALYVSHRIFDESSTGDIYASAPVYRIAHGLIEDFDMKEAEEIFDQACLIFRDMLCSRWLTKKKKGELQEIVDRLGDVYRVILDTIDAEIAED